MCVEWGLGFFVCMCSHNSMVSHMVLDLIYMNYLIGHIFFSHGRHMNTVHVNILYSGFVINNFKVITLIKVFDKHAKQLISSHVCYDLQISVLDLHKF